MDGPLRNRWPLQYGMLQQRVELVMTVLKGVNPWEMDGMYPPKFFTRCIMLFKYFNICFLIFKIKTRLLQRVLSYFDRYHRLGFMFISSSS